ncbi:MAG TPA: hypothetical protein VLW85_21995 [Myxococcales bacterium]|nr:hypothetical protein [Myxococcales bacterium]
MRVLLSILCVAAAARASSVTDELSASNSQSTPSAPRSGTVSDSLNATIDLGESWTLNLGALVMHEDPTPMPAPISFKNFTNDPFEVFNAGADFMPNDHWTIGFGGEFSPKSTQSAVPDDPAARNPTTAKLTPVYLLVNSTNSEWGARLDVEYDTAGDSSLEWSISGAVQFSANSLDQNIPGIRFDNLDGTYTAYSLKQLNADCTARPADCPLVVRRALRQAAATGTAPLDVEKLSLSATATIDTDTDLTLSGDYYLYDQDPTQISPFGARLQQTLGNGLTLAPLQYLVRPEVLHRWGGFSARLYLQAGEYVAGMGESTVGLGLKLQYKFSKAFRMWATFSGQRDVDVDGTESDSGSLALGAGYRF